MNRLIRPSADKTRQRILKAAKTLFLAKGFDGVTIKAIAQKAQVHTNLIFHHYSSKENLWQEVKSALRQKSFAYPNYDESSAKAFFKSLLAYRFKLYQEHPDLVKLIQWQQLFEKESILIGHDPSSPNHWLEKIECFQKRGEITTEFTAKHIMLFIIYSSHAPFFQNVLPLNLEEIRQYQTMMFKLCCQQFLTKGRHDADE